MSQNSAIEWTDTTWNPVRGCTKVSPGCAHCYAETFAERFRGVKGHPYEQGFDLRLVPEKLTEPLTWKKPRRVFVNSMSDLFQDGVPDSFIDQVFAVMALSPQHTFQVLTKRADRMREYFRDQPRPRRRWESAAEQLTRHHNARFPSSPVLPNVWLGVSPENQHFADERIPLLLETPAAVRFLSCEPLLEYMTLSKFIDSRFVSVGGRKFINAGGIGLVIAGGESGPGARQCYVDWLKNLMRECREAGVPFFLKQLGAVPLVTACRQRHHEWGEGKFAWWQNSGTGVWRVKLKDRKGGDMAEWPEDLRVREFPRPPQ